MPERDVQFWTNQYGHNAWVFNPGSTPAWRNLRTGEYALDRPGDVNQPTSSSALKVPSQYPYLGEYVSAPAAAPAPSRGGTPIGVDPAFRSRQLPSAPVVDPTADPYSFLTIEQLRSIIFSPESSAEEVKRASAILAAGGGIVEDGAGGVGRTGPTAAELAIQRSQIDATNLATFISGTIAELELEIDAKRLSTEQALGEFNKRLDAFTEAGKQFKDIQPYTIPIGAEYAPGFGPGEIGEELGIKPRKAEVIQFDPFAMADRYVAESQDLTEIGVPSGDELAEAIRLARGFLGG